MENKASQHFLVTGGAGFIGSHLVKKLAADGHYVTIVDNLSTGSLDNLKELKLEPFDRIKILYENRNDEDGKIQLLRIDVSDLTLYNLNPEGDYYTPPISTVFHLAALPRIGPSFDKPYEYYLNNSKDTFYLLQLIRKLNLRYRKDVLEYPQDVKYQKRISFIYVSSSSASNPYLNPYAYTKWLGEQHCMLYQQLYPDCCIKVARPYNVYGPNQPTTGQNATLLGIWEDQYIRNIPLTITGDGDQQRDFTHVYDVVGGLIELSKSNKSIPLMFGLPGTKDEYGQSVNIDGICHLGTGNPQTVLALARLFNRPIRFVDTKPGEVFKTQANLHSTNYLIPKWKPKYSVTDYLKCRINSLDFSKNNS